MHGLVAYDDDSFSESEGIPKQNAIDINPKGVQKQTAESRRTLKSQVIIKRPTLNHRNHHPRGHANRHPEEEKHDDEGSICSDAARIVPVVELSPGTSDPHASEREESSLIREILKPPPILEVEDWGIPPDGPGICNPALQTKLAQFCSLKKDPLSPKHFNDSLMSNRSFRNPHLYAKLVEFVDVNERITNFPKDLWAPDDVRSEWFADRIAETQKERDERQGTSQASGKRNRIDFSASSDKERLSKKGRLYGYGTAGTLSAPNRQRMRLG